MKEQIETTKAVLIILVLGMVLYYLIVLHDPIMAYADLLRGVPEMARQIEELFGTQ